MTTKEELIQMVNEEARQDPEYFMHEGYYCDSVNCDDPDCDEHYGGVLDVERTYSTRGKINGLTILLTTGGPHIEFDPYKRRIIGYWGNETAYTSMDSRTCIQVIRYYSSM